MKVYQTNEIKNIAMLGSAGSGKTTLAESMLFESGVIKRRGSVEAKNTVSDYFPVEQEYGGRLSFFLSGIDFSLSALHTWNKMPVMHNGIGEYKRMTMIGGDLSVPAGQFVIRSEVAEYLDEAQTTFGQQDITRAASTNAL